MRWKILPWLVVVGVQGLLADSVRAQSNVVAWGDNTYGQCIVPVLPPGLSYVEVAAGAEFTVGKLWLKVV